MDLPRGITGIRGREDPSPVQPSSDLRSFRSHCHLAARAVGATVECIHDPDEAATTRNYAIALFRFSDSVVAVLLNAVYPIVGFARCLVAGEVFLDYINCPKLAESFRALGEYTVATSEELNRPLVREFCKDLAPSELKCVRYFRPARVGDVIFNYWD